jgi:hypothetical protein
MATSGAVTNHTAAVSAVGSFARDVARRARLGSSVGTAPCGNATARRARAAVPAHAAPFSSGDSLVEGPRGEVYASADEAFASLAEGQLDALLLPQRVGELKALLNQYLSSKINEDLHVPPTQVIQLDNYESFQ